MRKHRVCHLSGINVTIYLKQSTPRHRTSSPIYAGIFDLATHKVYGYFRYRKYRWALTPPFHPYPSPHPPYGHPLLKEKEIGKVILRRLFSVTLLCPHEQLPVRKYGALCCPDFPHYHYNNATNRFTEWYKDTKYYTFMI